MWRFYVLGVALQDVFIYCWSSNENITYLRLNCVGWKQPCFVVFIVKKKNLTNPKLLSCWELAGLPHGLPHGLCFPVGGWLVCPMVYSISTLCISQ